MSRDLAMPLPFDEITIPPGRRELNKAEVNKLAQSIREIGLRHPITVRRKGGGYELVAGRHRMEACKKAGMECVPAIICSMTNIDAKMWEIAENLHRSDLTAQERAIQIAEWVKLSDEKRISSQDATKPGRPESGERAAARELGLDKDAVNRAVKIASMSDEAKEAAEQAGLDDNQSALLAVAKESTPAAQVAKVIELKDRGGKVATWRDDFERLWRRGTEDDHRWARERTDEPVMDKRFGA